MDLLNTIYNSIKQNLEFLVLSITAIVLWWTGRAMWATYWLNATPNLSFTLEQVDPKKAPLHLYFQLRNDSRKDVKALVNTKVYTEDPQTPISLDDPFYMGEGAWTIPSGHHIRGHKNLITFLTQDIDRTPEHITIEVEICYREWSRLERRTTGNVYTIPTQKWHYSERGLIPVITDEGKPDFKCPER